MSHLPRELSCGQKEHKKEILKARVEEEFPALPEKFYTFTHEMIALLWMKETTQTPVRGRRSGEEF